MTLYKASDICLIDSKAIDAYLDTAALAYQSYPLFRYFVGSTYNFDAVKTILSASIKPMKDSAIGIASKEETTAFSIFVKPEYKGAPPLSFLAAGGIKLPFIQSPSLLVRLLNYENYAMQIKQKYEDSNCWYLYNLVVRPDHQGQGLASQVIRPMLEFFDATRQSCYLETHKKSNVPLYEHFGFKLMEIGKIPGTELSHYAMLRRPLGCV